MEATQSPPERAINSMPPIHVPFKVWLITIIGIAALHLLVLGMHVYTMGPRGNGRTADVNMLVTPVALGIFVVVCIAPFGLFWRRWRRVCLVSFLTALLFCPLNLWVISEGWDIRRPVIARIASNGQPIIDAIIRFEADHGRPPESLKQLIPDYLPALPQTGFNGYPEYCYTRKETGDPNAEGNPWMLLVDTTSGIMTWDYLFYYPMQNYPKRNHAGRIERIGTWAYVNE